MTNKPVLVPPEVGTRSGKRLRVGETDIAIRDDAVRVEFADLLTELRYHEGHIAISFAHGIWDEGNPAEAVVCARLRIPLGAAQLWSKLLGK